MPDFRSVLFAPGNRARMVEKAPHAGADAVVLDLEDAVPVAEKVATRAILAHLLAAACGPPSRFVRINALDTPWGRQDAADVVGQGVFGLMLPKVESASDIQSLEVILTSAEAAAGLPIGQIEILPIVETARGVLRAAEIAAAGPRVRRIAFGAYDFARDMDITLTASGEELLVPLATVALAARAARIQALDTVFAAIDDEAGLVAEARRARGLGFSGKMCIHPSQIAPVHRVFSPSAEEVDRAARVVSAFRAAVADGRASVALDGKMVDYPIAEQQQRLLERAASLGLPVPSLAVVPSTTPGGKR